MNTSKYNFNYTDKIILGTAQMGMDYGINNRGGKSVKKKSVNFKVCL